MLKVGSKSDVEQLAKIHFTELKSDFLPSLGIKFLVSLYREILKSKDNTVLVFKEENEVKGFIVGSKNFEKSFKKILRNNFLDFIFILFPEVVKNPLILKKIFETVLYTKKQGEKLPKSELVVIAVSEKSHRKGLGSKLVIALEKDFIKKRIRNYIVSVNKKNIIANHFYKSLGFKLSNEFVLYGKVISLYSKKIV